MSRPLSSDTKDALAHDIPPTPAAREVLATALRRYGACGDGEWCTRRLSIARLLHTLTPGSTITRQSGHARFCLSAMGNPGELPPPETQAKHRTLRRMELRGAFLACGSLSLERGGGYHLELVTDDAVLAARLAQLLALETLAPKRLSRRNREVVYLKDAEQIVTALVAMGAHTTVMHLEDLRAVKETKNRIRRLVNTEAANLDRTIDAAAAARDAITALIDAEGLSSLSASLREAALLRLEHPTASLGELAARCSPPVTKSTFSGRLLALRRRARRL